MFGRINRILGSRLARRTDEREVQKERTDALISHWQERWHALFDRDPNLITLEEFERPSSLPVEIAADFRLVFGISRVTHQTRAECFGLLPEGLEMGRRFEKFLSSENEPLNEGDARLGLAKAAKLIESIGPVEEVDFSKIRVVNSDIENGLLELADTDNVTVLLEMLKSEPVSNEDLPKIAAKRFLGEPLYAAAGNDTTLRDWVTSAMEGGTVDELQTELYQLWRGGWEVCLGPEEVILAHRGQHK